MPGSQIPLGRQSFRRNLHLHGRLGPCRRIRMRRQVGAAHRRDGALPGLLLMRPGLLANGAQFPGLEFLDELPGAGGLRGQNDGGLRGASLRRRCRCFGIEMPHVGIALAIGVGIAGMQRAHHVLRQVPDPALPAHLGDDQFDDGRVALVGALGADDQRNHVAGFDGYLAQFLRVGLGGNRLRAGSVRRAMGQVRAARSLVSRTIHHSIPLPPL